MAGRGTGFHNSRCGAAGFAIAVLALWSETVLARAEETRPVALFVHLSDLHISAEDPSRLNDLFHLGSHVLPHLSPEAIIISGDLTHSKTSTSPVTGRQIEREWQEYRSAVEHLAASTGLAEEAVLDVRGNHDAFDAGFTGGPRDFYSIYSALGARGMGGQRVHIHNIPSREGSPNSTATTCPAAVLVGIDGTPDCRIRSPINFSGTDLYQCPLPAQEFCVSLPGTPSQPLRPCGCALFIQFTPLSLLHADKLTVG